MAPSLKSVAKQLRNATGTQQRLKRQNFTLTNGAVAGETTIATHEVEAPLLFRQGAVRLMLVAEEDFTTDGSGTQQTFNLSGDVIPTNNTTDFVLYEGGSRVQADSVDYAANSFTYTGPGNAANLHAYYVFRDPVQVEITKTAPKSQGRVEEVIYDDVTSVLHERNQNKEPPVIDFSGKKHPELAAAVPRKWNINITATPDGNVAPAWSEDTDDTVAVNAVVSIPVNRANSDIPGLSQAVKQAIIDPEA